MIISATEAKPYKSKRVHIKKIESKPSSCSPPESHKCSKIVWHMQDHKVQQPHTSEESLPIQYCIMLTKFRFLSEKNQI